MRSVFCSLLFLFWSFALFGQVNTAIVSGSVTDSSGGIVVGAQLELLDEQRGVRTEATTNSAGQYVFEFVPVGHYSLTVREAGFEDQTRTGIILAAAQSVSLDIQLQVSTARQQVTVTTAGEALDLATSDQHMVIGSRDVSELPQAKLDWTNLLQLDNGVTKNSGAVSMNGLPTAGFNLTVDGTNASSDAALPQLGFYLGFNTINTLNSDAIEEISTTKGIAPASVAGSLAGNVNLITKSGTNQFHGSLLEINSVAAYNARNQFLKTRPGSTFNQFGGAIGGPILPDKLFFFLDYQAVRSSAFTAISGSVPTPAFKSSVLAQAPEYTSLLNAFPSPNQPFANGATTGIYQGTGSTTQNDSNGVGRIDYYLTQRDWLTVRFIRSWPDETQPRVIAADERLFTGHDEFYNLQYNHTGGSWNAVTRIGFNRSRFDRVDEGYFSGLDEIIYAGIDTQGGEANLQKGASQSWEESIALIKGRHSLEFGGILQRQDAMREDLNTSQFTYSSLSDFLGDIPSKLLIQPPLEPYDIYNYQYGGFIQDNYRALSSLTLNLGFRYDYFTVPREEHGRMFNRDANSLGPGFGDFRPVNSAYDAYYPNLSPRVGLAWALGKSRKTVIRSGFGVFFNPHPLYQGVVELALTAPNVPLKLTLNRAQALAAGLRYPVNTAAYLTQLEASGAPIANTSINPDFPNPYSMQWTFGVQRELPWGFVLDTAYVANRGIHFGMVRMENLPDRLTGLAVDPAFGQFRWYDSSDSSYYNSWQTSLNRRFSHGLAFGLHYTWSSNLAFGGDDLLLEPTPQDNNNLRADYGPTPFDVRQTFNTNFVYQLPFAELAGFYHGVGKLLLGGWEISGIFSATSGLPVNVTINNSSYANSRPDAVAGVDAIEANFTSTLQYLNPAAFALIPIIPASGATARPGDLGRNALRAPGMWDLDSSLSRNFVVMEKVRLQLHADLFNAFNHTNLSGLQTNLSSSNFGQLTSATARTMQIGAHLTF